ncbi:Uncharacterised protein [Mycobacteroides abscessus subsp. abscessus]|nr:Uncharacterised protein [Mycobacteroides abscessus subsp. abscessus]
MKACGGVENSAGAGVAEFSGNREQHIEGVPVENSGDASPPAGGSVAPLLGGAAAPAAPRRRGRHDGGPTVAAESGRPVRVTAAAAGRTDLPNRPARAAAEGLRLLGLPQPGPAPSSRPRPGAGPRPGPALALGPRPTPGSRHPRYGHPRPRGFRRRRRRRPGTAGRSAGSAGAPGRTRRARRPRGSRPSPPSRWCAPNR